MKLPDISSVNDSLGIQFLIASATKLYRKLHSGITSFLGGRNIQRQMFQSSRLASSDIIGVQLAVVSRTPDICKYAELRNDVEMLSYF